MTKFSTQSHDAVTDAAPLTQQDTVFRVTCASSASTESRQTPGVLPIGCTPRAARSGRWTDVIGAAPRPEDQVRCATKSPWPANWPGKAQAGSPPPPSVCSRIFRAHPYAPEPSSIPHHARITKMTPPTNARRTQTLQIPFPAQPSPTFLRPKNAYSRLSFESLLAVLLPTCLSGMKGRRRFLFRCQTRPRAPVRPLFRPLRAMHCPLRNLTHASHALTGVAGRWQAGVGEVPRILLDEIQARAPPDAIVHVSQAG